MIENKKKVAADTSKTGEATTGGATDLEDTETEDEEDDPDGEAFTNKVKHRAQKKRKHVSEDTDNNETLGPELKRTKRIETRIGEGELWGRIKGYGL